jgi:hypothetical protein
MSKFAVLNGEVVDNLIVADTKEVAEQITGSTCVEADDVPGILIGVTKYVNGEFVNPEQLS